MLEKIISKEKTEWWFEVKTGRPLRNVDHRPALQKAEWQIEDGVEK